MDKLTGYGQSSRQLFPIVGMGGIGKTTLARNVYENPLIVQYFHICAWVTISQEYDVRGILLEALLCLENHPSKEILSEMIEGDLGQILYESLCGRRYLIVMDDMWSIEAWYMVKLFFPDNNNGSRIMITTRLSQLAFQLPGSRGLEMNLLHEDESWNLLCKQVFGEESCSPELEDIGRIVASKCKGLPLSIVVIGGLLAKSEMTPEYGEYVAANLSETVNLEDNERCLKILSMSYTQLPVHLKPCFLYMGVFPEDKGFRVSSLIKLWVAEGFLRPVSGKCLEEVAEDYLKDLIDRNLILVHSRGSTGKIKLSGIHDLLRDVGVRQGKKEKFFCVIGEHNLISVRDINTQRHLAVQLSTSNKNHIRKALLALQSPSLTRFLVW